MKALLLFVASLAPAQVFWVASTGSDSPTCGPRDTPCRTWQRAHNNAGESATLRPQDSGDFGPLNITKSVHIDGSGLAITDADGIAPAIALNTSASVTVRNLTLSMRCNSGPRGTAIEFTAGSLLLENITLSGCFQTGLLGRADSTNLRLAANALKISGPSTGILIEGISLALRQTTITNTTTAILVRYGRANSAGFALIEDTSLSLNSTALQVDAQRGGATVRLADSLITNNATGLSQLNGGVIFSYRNNRIFANTVDGSTPFGAVLQ